MNADGEPIAISGLWPGKGKVAYEGRTEEELIIPKGSKILQFINNKEHDGQPDYNLVYVPYGFHWSLKEKKADLLDRLVDFIIRDYLLTCDDEQSRDFGRHATAVFEYAKNYMDDGTMHIGGVEIAPPE